jgi:hypothetical protein
MVSMGSVFAMLMADYEFVAIWTAVSYHTAILAHPQHSQPRLHRDGWLQYMTDSGPSRIWLPAERRPAEAKAVTATGSRLVIGSQSGGMTTIALSR